jgi:glycerophosphoryl diester phosphodiesterase
MSLTASKRVLNIAHRGARAFAPENTLVAFAKAKSFGCDMFELDVRLTKDKEVVVYHDDHLKRCTDAEKKFPGKSSYQLADFTYLELKTLDAGSWYNKQLTLPSDKRQPFLQSLTDSEISQYINQDEQIIYGSGTIKIPTLAETLCLAKEFGLLVNVELKSHSESDSTLVSAVLQIIEDMKVEEQILISSFNLDLLRLVRLKTKKIATAALIDTPVKNPLTLLRKLKANAYNLGCFHDYQINQFNSEAGKRYLDQIKKLRKAGFAVNIWTCNDPVEMQHLLSADVSGLISDYPNRVREKLSDCYSAK